MSETRINRREFTIASALAALSGVLVTVGCGSDSPSSNTPPATEVAGTISGNHGHVATVTAAQITAGGMIVLNIQGSSPHDHTVELTAAELVSVRDRRQVVKTSSSTASHTHAVTFN
jgi:hypothetical protein